MENICEWENCKESGKFKAPLEKDDSRKYKWLCEKHAIKNGEKYNPILAVCALTHRRETTQPQTGQNSKTIRDLTHLGGTRRAKTGQQIESKHDLTHRCEGSEQAGVGGLLGNPDAPGHPNINDNRLYINIVC